MDRTEVLERLEPIMNTQVREVEHNPRTRVVVTPDMVTFRPGGGARILEVTEGGVQSMANYIGLPALIAAKLRPETFGAVSTELLGAKNRYALVVKDGAVTSFTKRGAFNTVNPERALRAIENAIPQVDFHRVLILDNQVASLEVIGDRRQPVSRGDLIQAGAQVTFSPIGTIDPMVQSYVLRLACTNGQTSNTILRQFHFGGGGSGGGGGEGDDIWQWFRRSVRDSYNALDQIVTRYRQMMNERIPAEARSQFLEALLREAKITGKDAETVRSLAIDNPPDNHYQLMNLLTRATSHVIENPERVRRAQLAVASFTQAQEHHRICPICHARHN